MEHLDMTVDGVCICDTCIAEPPMQCDLVDDTRCPNTVANVYTVTFQRDNVVEAYRYCELHSAGLERDATNERDPFTFTKVAV